MLTRAPGEVARATHQRHRYGRATAPRPRANRPHSAPPANRATSRIPSYAAQDARTAEPEIMPGLSRNRAHEPCDEASERSSVSIQREGRLRRREGAVRAAWRHAEGWRASTHRWASVLA